MNWSARAVVIILRVIGFTGLFAFPAVFLPTAWMAGIHAWAGLGEMPEAPVVSYLARSLSAFYGSFSLMTLLISTDVTRFRPLVTLWGFLFTGMGILLFAVDLSSGMPGWWTVIEGPPSIVVGLAVLALHRRRFKDADFAA